MKPPTLFYRLIYGFRNRAIRYYVTYAPNRGFPPWIVQDRLDATVIKSVHSTVEAACKASDRLNGIKRLEYGKA